MGRRSRTAGLVVVLLLAADQASPAAVTEELGVARSTLEHHLDGLVSAGVVAKRRTGNRVTLSLRRPAATAGLLRTVEPTFAERLTDRFERLLDQLLEGA